MASREYTPEQLQAMQQEAAARVREMQRRARARLEGTAAGAEKQEPPPEPPHTEASPGHTPQHTQPQEDAAPSIPTLSPPVPPQSHTASAQQSTSAAMQSGYAPVFPLSGLLGMTGGDSDRLTLLLLMLLLSADGQCSPGLMAALFWLMTP